MKSIILILLACSYLSAEFTFQYAPENGNVADFTTSHVSSDFGQRCIKRNSVWRREWHKGVDYSRPVDRTHLLALDNGSVNEIYVADYKVIKIDGGELDFGFGHVFRGGTPPDSGMVYLGMRLKRMNPPYHDRFSIIYNNIAIGFVDTNELPTVTVGDDTLAVTDSVTTGQRIAPLGDAASTNYHVHLYCFKNGFDFNNKEQTKDPLEFLSHAEPNYEITLDSLYLVYPGDSLSSVKVRCKMLNPDGSEPPTRYSYDYVTMNVDNVELHIKKDFEPDNEYNLIKGNSFESKIIHGARFSTTRYPSPGNPSWCSNTDIANTNHIGSSTRTGIKSYAYCDSNGYPYDDFYFSDIFLRIDKDDTLSTIILDAAEINSEARYPDGKYTLKAKAVTVRDSIYWSEEQELLIDNFVPYIKEVEVRSNNSKIYQGGWTWYDNVGLRFGNQQHSYARPGVDITIHVTASEPMDTLYIADIQPLGTFPTQHETVSNDRTEWVFRIPGANIPQYNQDGDHTITINGTDLAGNPLVLLQSSVPGGTYAPSDIPIRQTSTGSPTDWLPMKPSGADSNNFFEIRSTSAGINYDYVVHGIIDNTTIEPEIQNFNSEYSSKKYIIGTTSSYHEYFDLVAWGYSTEIDTFSLKLDNSYVQPYFDHAYDGMSVKIENETYTIVESEGVSSNTLILSTPSSYTCGEYIIYAPLDREVVATGTADSVSNVNPNSVVWQSDSYQNSVHFSSPINSSYTPQFTLSMSNQTYEITGHTDPEYIYQPGEFFFSDSPTWANGYYEISKQFPVSTNDIVYFGDAWINPTPGQYTNSDFGPWVTGWNNFGYRAACGELDGDTVYNVEDHRDYFYNGSAWEALEYPEVEFSPSDIACSLDYGTVHSDSIIVTNSGDGELEYSVSVAANADTTFVDTQGETDGSIDVTNVQCSIGSSGFYSNIETNGFSPLGVMLIDVDQNTSTGIPWINDGSLPNGSVDSLSEMDFTKLLQTSNSSVNKSNRNEEMGVDYFVYAFFDPMTQLGNIEIVSADSSHYESYTTISASQYDFEFTFPIAFLEVNGVQSDGNLNYFYLFFNNENTPCELVPDTGYMSIGNPSDWLQTTSTTGVLSSGSSDIVDLTIDSSNLAVGNYEAQFIIGSNDELYPWLYIPISLEVVGAQDIEVFPQSFNFGNVIVSESLSDTLKISNAGTELLTISNISSNNADFIIEGSGISIPPGNTNDFLLTFTPVVLGESIGEIEILSDDPDEPSIIVSLCGAGVDDIVPPTNLTAEIVYYDDVDLVWDAPGLRLMSDFEETNKVNSNSSKSRDSRSLIGYNVYRDELILDNMPILLTTITDEDVPDGIHTYSVKAVYTGDIESEPCESDPVTIAPPPSNLTAEIVDYDDVDLVWEAPGLRLMSGLEETDKTNRNSSKNRDSRSLTGYNVYRDEILLGNITMAVTAFTDEDAPDGTHIYSVKAVYTGDIESESCESDSVTISPPPSNLITEIVDFNDVDLDWDAPGIRSMSDFEETNNTERNSSKSRESRSLIGYNVYRDEMIMANMPIIVTEYTDEDVPDGAHVYSVKAVYTGDIESEPCESDPLIIAPPPTNLTAVIEYYNNVNLNWDTLNSRGVSYSNKAHKVSWNSSKSRESRDLIGYNVYRNGVLVNSTPILDTEFDDQTLPDGNYSYYVTAIYDDGLISEPSNTVENVVVIPTGTWTISGSPYIINGDATIPDLQTLNINQSVEVRFLEDASLIIIGSLNAIGTDGNEILFTSSSISGYEGLLFEDAGISNLTYCIIEYADIGINIIDTSSDITLSNNIIQNNTQGIWTYNSNLEMTFNLIINNDDNGIAFFNNANFRCKKNVLNSNGGYEIFLSNSRPSFRKALNDFWYDTGFTICTASEYYPPIDMTLNWWGTDNIPYINANLLDSATMYDIEPISLSQNSTYTPRDLDLSLLLYESGKNAMRVGNYIEAEAIFKELILTYPHCDEISTTLSSLLSCKIFTRCLHFLDKNTQSISQLESNRQFLYEVSPNYKN